jgi:lysophospholipase L1-like esterase
VSLNRSIKAYLALTVVLASAMVGASGYLVIVFYERSLIAQFPIDPVIRGNPQAQVVFLGDSRVAAWSKHDRLGALYIGFPGATSSQIGNQIDAIQWPETTKTIVIQAGVNDMRILGLRPKDRVARVAATHAEMLELVESCLDHAAEVLLLLVLPVGEPPLIRSVVWSESIPKGVDELNQRLAKTRWPTMVRLVDAPGQLGRFDSSMFTDELHFSEKAYAALNGLVAGIVTAGRH